MKNDVQNTKVTVIDFLVIIGYENRMLKKAEFVSSKNYHINSISGFRL